MAWAAGTFGSASCKRSLAWDPPRTGSMNSPRRLSIPPIPQPWVSATFAGCTTVSSSSGSVPASRKASALVARFQEASGSTALASSTGSPNEVGSSPSGSGAVTRLGSSTRRGSLINAPAGRLTVHTSPSRSTVAPGEPAATAAASDSEPTPIVSGRSMNTGASPSKYGSSEARMPQRCCTTSR